MHLDHVSYATSHDNIVDVVQRIGSQLGASFIDGGIHPQFGTRNFILPLKDSRYIEVVCPLDHPASDKSPFGQLVTRKADEGGGWLTWVIAVDDLSQVEEKLSREAVLGHRRKPDGRDLYWKQIGVLDSLEESSNPFFIQWTSSNHPSAEGLSEISLDSLEIYGDEASVANRYDLHSFLDSSRPAFKWLTPQDEQGIGSITFSTARGLVKID
jgi:Glyoxalase-like domain